MAVTGTSTGGNPLNIVFPSPINTSCQIGDFVWSTVVSSQDQNNTIYHGQMGNIILLGKVIALTNPNGLDPNINYIGMTIQLYDNDVEPAAGDFLIFSKDKRTNTSGITGYYAQAHFRNNSVKPAELFSVGSQIETSSK